MNLISKKEGGRKGIKKEQTFFFLTQHPNCTEKEEEKQIVSSQMGQHIHSYDQDF